MVWSMGSQRLRGQVNLYIQFLRIVFSQNEGKSQRERTNYIHPTQKGNFEWMLTLGMAVY